jgi:hypothetical protein
VAVALTPRAALRDVERATRARQRVDAEAAAAKETQADAIRNALAAGASVAEIAGVTGLSTPRIYQIRDGRR